VILADTGLINQSLVFAFGMREKYMSENRTGMDQATTGTMPSAQNHIHILDRQVFLGRALTLPAETIIHLQQIQSATELPCGETIGCQYSQNDTERNDANPEVIYSCFS
jgi:hypothetical protein